MDILTPGAPNIELHLDTGNGHGSTNNKIRRFTNSRKNTLGGFATYADSAANGMSVTVAIEGLYAVSVGDENSAGGCNAGISVNGSALTTAINSCTYAQGFRGSANASNAGLEAHCTAVMWLAVGDIVRAHTDGNPNGSAANSYFRMTKIGDS